MYFFIFVCAQTIILCEALNWMAYVYLGTFVVVVSVRFRNRSEQFCDLCLRLVEFRLQFSETNLKPNRK